MHGCLLFASSCLCLLFPRSGATLPFLTRNFLWYHSSFSGSKRLFHFHPFCCTSRLDRRPSSLAFFGFCHFAFRSSSSNNICFVVSERCVPATFHDPTFPSFRPPSFPFFPSPTPLKFVIPFLPYQEKRKPPPLPFEAGHRSPSPPVTVRPALKTPLPYRQNGASAKSLLLPPQRGLNYFFILNILDFVGPCSGYFSKEVHLKKLS